MAEQTVGEWNVEAGSIAENYERYLVPAIFVPIATALLDLVAPRPGDHVLDVASGTGIVARLAAERVGPRGRVVGLDFLPGMLAQARSQPATDPPVEWEQASADSMPFPDGAFTVVLCQHGLQFFPDKPAALREMGRVLAPDGKLGLAVLRDISHAPALAALAEALTRNIGPGPASFVQMVGSLGNETELRSLVEGAGFRDVHIDAVTQDVEFPSPEEFVRQYLISTPLAANPSIKEAGEDVRAAVAEDVRSKLAPYVSENRAAVPAVSYVVTARR